MTHINKLIIKASLKGGETQKNNLNKTISPKEMVEKLEEMQEFISEEIDRKIADYDRKNKNR
jgi:hypothetical protein